MSSDCPATKAEVPIALTLKDMTRQVFEPKYVELGTWAQSVLLKATFTLQVCTALFVMNAVQPHGEAFGAL